MHRIGIDRAERVEQEGFVQAGEQIGPLVVQQIVRKSAGRYAAVAARARFGGPQEAGLARADVWEALVGGG
ncbi:MAG: hypothetical protein ACK5U4_21655, partial [Rhodospirillales bacterium]